MGERVWMAVGLWSLRVMELKLWFLFYTYDICSRVLLLLLCLLAVFSWGKEEEGGLPFFSVPSRT